jgi:hypothetical protein
LARLNPVFRESAQYPSIFASAGWSNTRRPPLGISREDGVTLNVTARERGDTAVERRTGHRAA